MPVTHLSDLTGRREAIRVAAARKRLLQARYMGWALGTPSQPGVIGPWGEHVVHEAFKAAAVHGYLLVNPEGGHVTTLFGARVPGGPIDNVAQLQVLDSLGRPAGTVVVLVEVKNVRGWVYPESPELFQLLDKAAQLQLANPDLSFLPLLVCRRAQQTTFYAAHDLGFLVVDLQAQFLPPIARIDRSRLEEVRRELGYLDLAVGDVAPEVLVRRLSETLRAQASKFAAQWRLTSAAAAPLFGELRKETLAGTPRRRRVNALRDIARGLPGTRVGW